MSFLDQNEIIEKYSQIDNIWDETDRWHIYTHKQIQQFIHQIFNKYVFRKDIVILNAGSAGEEYGLEKYEHLHIDIVDTKIKNKKRYIVSSIENFDLDEKVDFVLCIGSVLNYVDPMQVFNQFDKILKDKGYLILEFEKSSSLEYITSSSFNSNSAPVTTFYKEQKEIIRVYSEKYISSILEEYHFQIIASSRFHILSPIIYKLIGNSNFAAKFTFADKLLKKLYPISYFSSNVIYFCQKI